MCTSTSIWERTNRKRKNKNKNKKRKGGKLRDPILVKPPTTVKLKRKRTEAEQ